MKSETTENKRKSFVLLKVAPLRVTAENGRTLITYGMLDSAVFSSMITSNIADKLQIQGVPDKVSVNTVTQRDQNLELCKVKLNVLVRYCPSQLDLSPWPHFSGLQLPNTAVSVLIGQDVRKFIWFLTIAGEVVHRANHTE